MQFSVKAGLIFAAILLAGALFFLYRDSDTLPAEIASGNGRLEATEVDVASRDPGRISSILVREGDEVQKGEVLARMDTDALDAELRAAEARAREARAEAAASRTAEAGAQSALALAQNTADRTGRLIAKGFVSAEKMDLDANALKIARANASAARSRVLACDEAVAALDAKAGGIQVALAETSLKAPISGRVLYRLAQPGEVIPSGGKVLTLIDTLDVTISIFLPEAEAGKVSIGSPARILLDALPNEAIPGKVTFVAPRAQFTPKEVETRNEREKLMFRVRVTADPAWLKSHPGLAKPGMPGLAYVLMKPDASWPSILTTK
ncbi:MAG: efflux RND transporter periplasmic adaptor subunit [Burkholderiales bacterium]|nr:efflux RND transporter periplasmic adaptor subunit [Burkholderiales bacterium]